MALDLTNSAIDRVRLRLGDTTCPYILDDQTIDYYITKNSGNARGEYPVGVYFHKASGKFQAHCAVNGKLQHLGCFDTPEEAFAVYKPFKENLCKQLA